jgi:hypothetical protein
MRYALCVNLIPNIRPSRPHVLNKRPLAAGALADDPCPMKHFGVPAGRFFGYLGQYQEVAPFEYSFFPDDEPHPIGGIVFALVFWGDFFGEILWPDDAVSDIPRLWTLPSIWIEIPVNPSEKSFRVKSKQGVANDRPVEAGGLNNLRQGEEVSPALEQFSRNDPGFVHFLDNSSDLKSV